MLEERYAAEHPYADPLDARRHVLGKLGAYMGVGAGGFGELIGTVADFTPVVGELKSFVEGVGDLVSAVQADDPAERRQLMAQAALGFLGAVPFAGKGIKAGKKVVEKVASLMRHGDDATANTLKELDAPVTSLHVAKPETHLELSAEELEEQKYLKEYHELTRNSGKRGRPFSLKNLHNKEPALAKMTESELSAWQNRINPAVGSAAEKRLREIMVGGKLISIEEIDEISTAYRFDDGQKRIFDAVTGFDVKETEYPGFYERVLREIDEALAIDAKAGGGRRSPKQNFADGKVNKNYSPEPIKYHGKREGAKINATQIINFPVNKIPRHFLEESIKNTLRKGGASDDLVEAIPRIVDYYHDVEKSSGGTGMTVGSLILSVWMSAELISATTNGISEDGRQTQ